MAAKPLRLALFAMVVGLWSGVPARADLIYSFTGTSAYGPLTGSFTVPDAAISDGFIRFGGVQNEVTSFLFTDQFATFSPTTVNPGFGGTIIVDPVTGGIDFPLGGVLSFFVIDPDPPLGGEVLQLVVTNFLPSNQYYSRLGDLGFQASGSGTWQITRTVIPEPSSVTLVLAGIAGLAGSALVRRRRRVAPAP